MSAPVLLDFNEGVATLTLNRPEALNALSGGMMEALAAATGRLAGLPGLRVVVIKGAGKHFMAGGDLKDFATRLPLSADSRRAEFRAMIEQYINPSVLALQSLPVPVVACVQGACAGFGLSLILGCDLVLAAEDAYFTTAYSSIALSGDGGVSWFLPRLVGSRKAFELLLLAERFDAAEALRLGLVNWVLPAAGLEEGLAAWVRRVQALPAGAAAEIKMLLAASPDQSLGSQLQREAEAFARCTAGPDFAEGVQAFLGRRRAVFGQG